MTSKVHLCCYRSFRGCENAIPRIIESHFQSIHSRPAVQWSEGVNQQQTPSVVTLNLNITVQMPPSPPAALITGIGQNSMNGRAPGSSEVLLIKQTHERSLTSQLGLGVISTGQED